MKAHIVGLKEKGRISSVKKKTRKILYEIIFADVSISFLPEFV